MIECNYCGRVFKHKYETCPGCGAANFSKISGDKSFVVKKVPKDGYKVDFNYYDIKKYKPRFYLGVSIIFLIQTILLIYFLCKTDDLELLDLYIFGIPFSIIMLIISIWACINNYNDIYRKERILKHLSKNGTLIKNIEYEPINVSYYKTKEKSYVLKINYYLNEDVNGTLTSEKQYTKEELKNDKTADLLIDENNLANYVIDLEIY